MRKIAIILTCTLLLAHNLLLSQDMKYTQHDIDTFSFWYATKEKADVLKSMLQSDKTYKGWSKYYVYLAFVHLKYKVRDSASYYSKIAIQKYEEGEKGLRIGETSMAKAYYMIGLAEYFKGEKLKSIETLYKAYDYSKLHEEYGIDSWESSIINWISRIHQELGDYNLALRNKLKLLEFETYMSYPYQGGNALMNTGLLYMYLNKLDSAKYFLRKAKFRYTDESEHKIVFYFTKNQANITDVYNFLGYISLLQKNQDSALYYFDRSKSHYELHDLRNKYDKGSIMNHTDANHAYSLICKGKNLEAIDILNAVKLHVDSLENYERSDVYLKRITYDYLSLAYLNIGNSQKAIQLKDEFIQYLNFVETKNISNQLQQHTTFYELKEKEYSISKLESENKSQKTIIEQRNTINGILILLILLILLTGAIIIRQRRLKSKYKFANLEQRLLRSQLNPHFIFNALNSICGLAKSNSKKTVPFILKFSSLLRLILENSREEFVSLEDELQAINDYLELQSDFSNRFKYFIKVDDDISQDELLIPPMFIQPFIENSIKHGLKNINDGEISIEIEINGEEKLLKCLIKDNGIGYNKGLEQKAMNSTHESLSGKILEERLKLYAKSFNRDVSYKISDLTKKGRGTQIQLLLPYLIDN